MITPTNDTKHTITPSTVGKSGVTLWGDANVGWGDSIGFWGGPIYSVTNDTKHTITPTNQSKS
jgi:hypothetical protein